MTEILLFVLIVIFLKRVSLLVDQRVWGGGH